MPTSTAEADSGDETVASCDTTGSFGSAGFVPGLMTNTRASVGDVRLSPDYDTAYYSANYGGASDALYTATRATADSSFVGVTLLAGTTDASTDFDTAPTIPDDGLMLLFGWSAMDTFPHVAWARRPSVDVPFSFAGPVPGVNGTTGADIDPFLREDGSVLYFTSSRGGNDDIFRTTWDGVEFAPPSAVDELNTDSAEDAPVVTPDDLTIYFASDRPGAGAQGGLDIWMAHRSSPDVPFSSPTNVVELNTADQDRPTFVTRDGCTLYISRTVLSISDTRVEYVARRQ